MLVQKQKQKHGFWEEVRNIYGPQLKLAPGKTTKPVRFVNNNRKHIKWTN